MGISTHADDEGNHMGRGGNIWKNLTFALPKRTVDILSGIHVVLAYFLFIC